MKSILNVQLYKNRRIIWFVSFSLSFLSIIGMLICFKSPTIKAPLNLGLDYTGGTQITLDRLCKDDCTQINTRDIAQNIASLTIIDKKTSVFGIKFAII